MIVPRRVRTIQTIELSMGSLLLWESAHGCFFLLGVFFYKDPKTQPVFWHAQLLPEDSPQSPENPAFPSSPNKGAFLSPPLGDVAQPHLAHMPCRSVSCNAQCIRCHCGPRVFFWGLANATQTAISMAILPAHPGSKHPQLH